MANLKATFYPYSGNWKSPLWPDSGPELCGVVDRPKYAVFLDLSNAVFSTCVLIN